MIPQVITIENNEYLTTELLGRGAYGIVFKGIHQQTGQEVAIKVQDSINDYEYQMLTKMKGKKFKNLINTLHVEKIDSQYYVVMEYCKQSLYERIQQKGTINAQDIRFIMREIANGIKEIHVLGYAHRDLKPENILISQITNEGQIQERYKICDFGTIKDANVLTTQTVGTAYYLAPEQINGLKDKYTSEVDIWAFGALIYELLTGEPMFNGYSEIAVWDKIARLNQNDIDQLIEKNLKIDQKYRTLLKNMMQIDIRKRHSINQIINDLNSRGDSVLINKPRHLENPKPNIVPQQNLKIGLPLPSQFTQYPQNNYYPSIRGNNTNQYSNSFLQNQNNSERVELASSQRQNLKNQNPQQQLQSQVQTNQIFISNQLSQPNPQSCNNQKIENSQLQQQVQPQLQTIQPSTNPNQNTISDPKNFVKEGGRPIEKTNVRQMYLSPQLQNNKPQVKMEFNNRETNTKAPYGGLNQIAQTITQIQDPSVKTEINQIQINQQNLNGNIGLKVQQNNFKQNPNTSNQQSNIDSNKNQQQQIAAQQFQQQIKNNNNFPQQNQPTTLTRVTNAAQQREQKNLFQNQKNQNLVNIHQPALVQNQGLAFNQYQQLFNKYKKNNEQQK
ncbi:unnamed protein product [Paramecium sonneborni]|uniref:Protein kinase domain-containing protein n=1 Tax=Paramecium sonneborni TaxID=65129 RepID=A0A8S1M0V1_9CILI|nr:unnamed protein product [Paramecium sonneborni]